MMVTKKLEGVSKKRISVQKTAFLASKRDLLGNEGPKTARRAAKWAPTERYPKLPQDMGKLWSHRVESVWAQKMGLYECSVKKNNFWTKKGPKMGFHRLNNGQICKIKSATCSNIIAEYVETSKNVWKVLKQNWKNRKEKPWADTLCGIRNYQSCWPTVFSC